MVRRGFPTSLLLLALAAGCGWWWWARSRGQDPLDLVRSRPAPTQAAQELGTPGEIRARFRLIGPAWFHDDELWRKRPEGDEFERAKSAMYDDHGNDARRSVNTHLDDLQRALDRQDQGAERWARVSLARDLTEWRAVLARHGFAP